MLLIHTQTSEQKEAVIERVTDVEFKTIKKDKRFKFNWSEQKDAEVYKLRLKDSDVILGLLSITVFDEEKWIEINLIESSSENIGKNKEYQNIAGILIAYTCRLAYKYGYDGCVALEPKTRLIAHYKNMYGFKDFGKRLYTPLETTLLLIQKYLT